MPSATSLYCFTRLTFFSPPAQKEFLQEYQITELRLLSQYTEAATNYKLMQSGLSSFPRLWFHVEVCFE